MNSKKYIHFGNEQYKMSKSYACVKKKTKKPGKMSYRFTAIGWSKSSSTGPVCVLFIHFCM